MKSSKEFQIHECAFIRCHNNVTKQLKRLNLVQVLNQYSAQDGMKDLTFLDEYLDYLQKEFISNMTEKH
jgi:hypothetical protein